jgi:predicted dehydrogenase
MIAACEASKLKLGIAYRNQLVPYHLEAMRFAREKVFGPLQHIDAGFGFPMGDPTQWRLSKKLAGGGAMMDVGVYVVQICRYLSGEEPVEVAGFEIKTDPVKFAEVDETISWVMRFKSGLTTNCLTTFNYRRDDFTAWGKTGRFGMSPCFSYGDVTGWTSDPKIPFEFPKTNHFITQMDAFSQAIIDARPFEVPGEEGLKDLLVIEAIYRAVASGKAEAVETV